METRDEELPGMWERSDFEGGPEEVRGPDWRPDPERLVTADLSGMAPVDGTCACSPEDERPCPRVGVCYIEWLRSREAPTRSGEPVGRPFIRCHCGSETLPAVSPVAIKFRGGLVHRFNGARCQSAFRVDL